MNVLNNKLLQILRYWSNNIVFESSEIRNLDFNQNNNETIELIKEIEFYISEGLTEARCKNNKTLYGLWKSLSIKNRSNKDYLEILKSIVTYTSEMLDKENAIPQNIKTRYSELVKIPINKRTNEEKVELSDLANKILQLSK